MLRFSKKADYAILLLAHLACEAGAESPQLRSAQDLASATGLGSSLTANLLKAYTKAGILTSVRGAHGGYRLERDPSDLSLLEILEVVEGRLQLVDCAEHGFGAETVAGGSDGVDTDGTKSAPQTCSHADVCPSRGPLRALQERIYSMLAALPLSELARRASPQSTLSRIPNQV